MQALNSQIDTRSAEFRANAAALHTLTFRQAGDQVSQGAERVDFEVAQ